MFYFLEIEENRSFIIFIVPPLLLLIRLKIFSRYFVTAYIIQLYLKGKRHEKLSR